MAVQVCPRPAPHSSQNRKPEPPSAYISLERFRAGCSGLDHSQDVEGRCTDKDRGACYESMGLTPLTRAQEPYLRESSNVGGH